MAVDKHLTMTHMLLSLMQRCAHFFRELDRTKIVQSDATGD